MITLDISSHRIDKSAFQRILKHAKLFPALRSLKLRACGLSDECKEELSLLMQLRLDAVDLANNELGEAGGTAILEGIRVESYKTFAFMNTASPFESHRFPIGCRRHCICMAIDCRATHSDLFRYFLKLAQEIMTSHWKFFL